MADTRWSSRALTKLIYKVSEEQLSTCIRIDHNEGFSVVSSTDEVQLPAAKSYLLFVAGCNFKCWIPTFPLLSSFVVLVVSADLTEREKDDLEKRNHLQEQYLSFHSH